MGLLASRDSSKLGLKRHLVDGNHFGIGPRRPLALVDTRNRAALSQDKSLVQQPWTTAPRPALRRMACLPIQLPPEQARAEETARTAELQSFCLDYGNGLRHIVPLLPPGLDDSSIFQRRRTLSAARELDSPQPGSGIRVL